MLKFVMMFGKIGIRIKKVFKTTSKIIRREFMPYDEEKTGNVDLANEVVTGYSIYNQDVKKRTKHKRKQTTIKSLPNKLLLTSHPL